MYQEYFYEIENIIKKNLEKRHMEKITLFGELEKSARELFSSDRVLIITGFLIKGTKKGETDGPIGAVSLAAALKELRKDVLIVTDIYSEPLIYAACKARGIDVGVEIISYGEEELFCNDLLKWYNPSHIVGIERPGKSKNGKYYSMRGEDLTDEIPNGDIIFENAKKNNITTICIGDGGNEIGMGKVYDLVKQYVPKGELICAAFQADYLITAGVSNWGAHGLVSALAILSGENLLYDEDMEKNILQSIIKVGGIDGCSKKNTLTVDGLSLKENTDIINELRKIIQLAFEKNKKFAFVE
ncbi:DUF4392 domain-containing protein [Anaerophilus nitritogenes]|uniref:DUF4392 domain-containing protein n=1 Tax=Anaerophilus nitritogenes TaxID=2498136 RepID=UPI0013EE0D30|nr:DUF4392 domain-containing protein [Anaerophilus nitritogenes]